MNDDCITWDIDERFRKMFPNGLTQQQIDEANRVMWKATTHNSRTGDTFFCGICGELPISQYPHECPCKQEG